MTEQTSHLMSYFAYQIKLVNSIRASLDAQVASESGERKFTPHAKDYRTPLQDVC